MNSRITLVIIVNLLLHQDQATAGLRVIFDRIEPIKVTDESKVEWVALHIAPHNNSIAQAEFLLSEDVAGHKLKITIDVVKCMVREAPDTCEFLINLKPRNVCMYLNAKHMAWSTIIEAFTPELRCPFKKGRYATDAFTVDVNNWQIFPLEKWYFKITHRLYLENVLSMGFILEAHVKRFH